MAKTLNWLRAPEWLLVGLMFMVHGWLLLNDGVYFDGWLVYFPIEENNFDQLDYVMSIYGHVTRPYIHWAAGWLGGAVFGHKLLAFLSLLGVAIFASRLGTESKLLSKREAMWVAITFMLFPAYQIAPELIMLPYHVSYFLFMLATYLMFRSIRQKNWLLRIIALPLFAISFWINSFLMFFGGIVIFLWLSQMTEFPRRLQDWIKSGLNFALHYPDLMSLPFVFWVILRPLNEPDHAYNDVSFSLGSVFSNLSSFIQYSLIGQLTHSLDLIWGLPLLLLVAILLGQWLYDRLPHESSSLNQTLGLAIFGGILFAFAITPYLAVDKAPALHGWYTRHALLMSLPIGLLTVALWRGISTYLNGLFPRLIFTILVILWVGYGMSHWESYFQLQARWAKDASVAEHLRQDESASEIDIFWIDDRFPTGWGELFYYNYDWAGIFKTVWSDSQAVGIFFDNYAGSYYWISQHLDPNYYFGVDFQPQGCQAILTIERGTRPTHYSASGLSIRYLAYKYLYPKGLNEFLLGVTQTEVRRILSAEATDCPIEQSFLQTLPADDPLFIKLTPTDDGAYNHLNRLAFIIDVERRSEPNSVQPVRYPDLQQDMLENTFYPPISETRAITPFPEILKQRGIDEDLYYRYYQAALLLEQATDNNEEE